MRFKVLIDEYVSFSWTWAIFRKQEWAARQRLIHGFVNLCGSAFEQYSEPTMVNTIHQIVTLSPAFTSNCVLGNLKSDDYKSGLRGLHNESHSWRFHMEKKWGKEVLSSGLCQFWIQPQLHPNRLCDLVPVSLHFQVWLLIFKRGIIIYQFTYFLQWLKEIIPVKTWHSKYSWVLFPQSTEQIPSEYL